MGQQKTLFANGGDLKMYLKGISPKKKVRVAIQILQKMVTFWKLAYIHRDIKEVNFLVHDEIPYLADFDFASTCPIKPDNLNCGTPSHMLITGSKVNLLHADFYALGMTLAKIFGENFHQDAIRDAITEAKQANPDPNLFLGFIELDKIKIFFEKKSLDGLFNTLRLQHQGEAVFNIMKALLTSPQSFDLADLENAVNELVVH